MDQIVIEMDVPVPMRDGAVLRADVYRPAGDGTYPVLVSRGPYGKAVTANGAIDTAQIVRAGYIVVHQDTRGRFGSEGEWLPWKHEREDGYDTIEWAAGLPGSSGAVGAFGGSYMGSTTWSSAIAGAPSLKAIAPAITWHTPENGLFFRGGAIEHGLNGRWSLLMAASQAQKAGLPPETGMKILADYDDLARRTYWQLPAGNLPARTASRLPGLGVERALREPSTLVEADVSSKITDVTLPSLTLSGWYDVFLQGSLDNVSAAHAAGRTARLVVGPWDHVSYNSPWAGGQVGEVNFGLAAATVNGQTLTQVQQEWFDHWLKDLPANEAHESGVHYYVMGAHTWRAEKEWPPARATATDLFVHPDGTLRWDAPTQGGLGSEYAYDPANPVLTRGGNLAMSSEFPPGPFDQRDAEARDDVLVFTTAPLEVDTEITGRVRATVFASTDGPSTDWVVRLCEVDADGVSRNIVDGITRVRTEPGRIDEVEVDLWSTSVLVKAGHRLRVHVTSSNFPRWDRNLNTGEPVTEGTTMRVARNRIFHDRERPSRIALPIIAD